MKWLAWPLAALALAACAAAPVPAPVGSGDLGVVIGRADGALTVVDTSEMRVLGRVEGLGDLSHASVVYGRDGASTRCGSTRRRVILGSS